MKQTKLLLLLLFLLSGTIAPVSANDGELSRAAWQVTPYELAMTQWEADPEAEAVVLYETGKIVFVGNEATGSFDIHFRKRIKIKILNQAGLEYGEYSIPFYHSGPETEIVDKIKAVSYNLEEGQIVETALDKSGIYEEIIDRNWTAKKIAFPNVKPGTVIELEFQVESPFIFNMPEWQFQHKIPVVHSLLELSMIPFYEYIFILKGSQQFGTFQQTTSNIKRQWGRTTFSDTNVFMGMDNLPAFRDEDFITSAKDYMISVAFQLSRINQPNGVKTEIMSTWPKLCNDFLKEERFGKYISAAEKEAKKILPSLDLTEKDNAEKTQLITEYVKSNYAWNGFYGKFASKKAAAFINEKTGNSADINLFLYALLKVAGLDAHPILLSTRDHGLIYEEYPFQHFLNYVVAQVRLGDTTLYLDATDNKLKHPRLPSRCLNVRGLLAEKNSAQWVNVSGDNRVQVEELFDISFTEDKQQLEVIHRSSHNGDVVINEPQTFDLQTNIDDEGHETIYIAPFFEIAPQENIFRQKKRELPIDMVYRLDYSYKATIQLPDNYAIYLKPQNVNRDSKLSKLKYNIVQEGDNVLVITADYGFKNSVFQAKDYAALRAFYNEVIETLNNYIVLRKQ